SKQPFQTIALHPQWSLLLFTGDEIKGGADGDEYGSNIVREPGRFPILFRRTQSHPNYLCLGFDKLCRLLGDLLFGESAKRWAYCADDRRLREASTQLRLELGEHLGGGAKQIVPQFLSLLEHIEEEIWTIDPIIRDSARTVQELVRP